MMMMMMMMQLLVILLYIKNLSMQQAVEAHKVVRCQGSKMVVRSALRTSHPLPLGRFMVLISVRG
jgi:hypothetical protein